MAMNKTRFMRKRMLDHAFGRIAHPFPANVWIALFSDDPTDLGLLTDELTEDGYERVPITAKMSDAVLASGVITNSAEINVPATGAALEDWPEISHAGIMDAATAGNMLYFGPAVTSRVVENGDNFKIKIGQITIQER